MSERPPEQPRGDETPPRDAPDSAEPIAGYVPHHREEFLGWIKGHVPRRKAEAADDEPTPTVDEPQPPVDESS